MKKFHFLFPIKTILVAALLFNAFGTQFVYWKLNRVAKIEMRKKMGASINAAEITRISFHKDKPAQLIDDGKELLLHERKYDIVKITSSKDSVVYYCIHDTVETKLLASYKKAFLNDQAGGKPGRALKNILQIELQAGVLSFPSGQHNIYRTVEYGNHSAMMKEQHTTSLPDPPPKG